MARRHHRRHMKHRRNPSGKEAGKAALTILAVGAGAALVNKYMTDMTVPQGSNAARMTVKTAKAVQVGVGLVAGIALAAYNKPVLGAAVGAALVAPAAEPLYTALRAPATAGSGYNYGALPAYR